MAKASNGPFWRSQVKALKADNNKGPGGKPPGHK